MSRRKPKGLTAQDRELWQKVAQTTVPLHRDNPRKPIDPVETPAPVKQPTHHARPPMTKFQVGQKATLPAHSHDLAPDPADHLTHTTPRMDRKNFQRLKRGKLPPEGRIDLHGKTLAQAHPALTGFILREHAAGKRCVLVITGKGKDRDDDGPIPIRKGVLRHQVPQWLAMPPLGAIVLQVLPAHLKHGGTGAYYVYLRRSR